MLLKNKQLNVAVLAENLTFGGINRYCVDLSKGLSNYSDINVSLMALGDHSNQWLVQEAPAHKINIKILPMNRVFDYQVVGQLRRLLIEQQVDILHSQGYRGNMISRLAVRLGGLRTKLICTVHGVYHFLPAALQSKIYYALDYSTISASDHIIAVSKLTSQQVAMWCRRKPITVVHNGTQFPHEITAEAKLNSRRTLKISESTKVVSFFGRFSPQKGIDTLVDVVRKTLDGSTDIVFLIVGDGELRFMVEKLAKNYKDRVLLLGAQRDISPFYLATDVLLIPSPMEGLPMVLLEALAHGIPVIASRVGGIPEVITDAYNGFLSNPLDSDDICRLLMRILSDRKLQETLSHNAQITIKDRFSVAHMAEATRQVYYSTVN